MRIGKRLDGQMNDLLPLAEEIGTILKARRQTIGVSESSSGGLVSAALLAQSGASAYYRGGLFDQGSISGAMLAASIPSFWMGLILQQYLATDAGWFPVSGYGGPDADFADRMGHLVLPSIVLGVVNSALIIRFTRASMLDVLSDDYVRTARSKGMSERRVVLRHAFKNALIPVVTVVGLTFALLISGAVVTERVFNLPGIGSLVVGAVLRRDYPVIQGTLLLVAGLYVLINFLIDMVYLAIDPRVRY